MKKRILALTFVLALAACVAGGPDLDVGGPAPSDNGAAQ